ncbi:hypothetical protein AMC90_PD00965 (plasmid) [Rhizobium phaseoli]|nr:hypothetical protein AMC90_PD00965 [Rhizobium phaseoli]KKZ84195.1 hypothetical protein RPHASCH2410_PD04625 [Rhizobium phaseoli Ch24-10]
MGEDNTARTLTRMPRRAIESLCQLQGEHKTAIIRIEVEFADIAIADLHQSRPHA